MGERAVFLDRDNTIIADPGYIDDPDLVELMPDAAASIRILNEAGYQVVVVTNQSGVARGLVTEEQLAEIHERLREMLLEQGARLDAIYYCPYLAGPEATVERYRVDSDLRKPQPGMLLRAAEELDLALADSWMIGDSARDVVAGSRAGCRTILIAATADDRGQERGTPEFTAASLAAAVEIVIADPAPCPPAAIPQNTGSPAPATTAPPTSVPPDEGGALLEIRDILRRRERHERQEDFSVARLAATLTQMLALVTGGWGLAVVFDDAVTATARFALAIFLQLLALTAFIASSRR